MNPHGIPSTWNIKEAENADPVTKLYFKVKRAIYRLIGEAVLAINELGIVHDYVVSMVAFAKQTNAGSVIFCPNVTIQDYLVLMTDIQRQDFKRSLQIVFVEACRKMAHIKAHYGIERELTRYQLRMQKQEKARKAFSIIERLGDEETVLNFNLDSKD